MGNISPHALKLGRIDGTIRFCQGVFERIWGISNLQNLLNQINPCFKVGMLLESLFNLVDVSP